jgi:hypothetical protein
MRRSIVLVLLAALMVFAVVPAASAHVHRFNPVGCLTSDSPNSGAAVGFVKAADAASPMNGPTPIRTRLLNPLRMQTQGTDRSVPCVVPVCPLRDTAEQIEGTPTGATTSIRARSLPAQRSHQLTVPSEKRPMDVSSRHG